MKHSIHLDKVPNEIDSKYFVNPKLIYPDSQLSDLSPELSIVFGEKG